MIKTAARLERPNSRDEFERARNSLRAGLGNMASAEVVAAFERLESELDSGVRGAKPGLLGSTLSWNPDDRGLSEWIYAQHWDLADIARRAADLLERREGFSSPDTLRMMGLAFLHWGEAAKWIEGRRERFAYGWMHWLMSMATQAGCNLHPCEVRLNGRKCSATLESLFLRTLILDRFAGGNLSRPQSEVLDAWLCEWMPDMKATRAWPGEAAFRVDLDSKAGLRRGRRPDSGPALYLAIGPLEARRRAVVKEFHRGQIVPSLGLAADFRIEEHVAVLEQLRIAFESAHHEEDAPRDARRPVAGTQTEVCIGLAEIALRALRTDATSPASLAAAKASLSDTQRLRHVQFANEYEASRRFLRLIDASEAGFGFDATEKEATNIAVDDIISMRLERDGPWTLGRVTRRVPGFVHGHLAIGVQVICEHPKSVTLFRSILQRRPDDEEAFIYVAGPDASGAQDSFLVSESAVNDAGTREALIAGQQFTIRFNRVRRKGRGWALMGFEIVAARPAPAEPTVAPLRVRSTASLEAGLRADMLAE